METITRVNLSPSEMREVVDGMEHVGQPASEREVTLGLTTASVGERQRHPTQVLGHAFGEVVVGPPRISDAVGARREAVADHQPGHTTAGDALGARQTSDELQAVGLELVRHASGGALAIPAVACFGQGVGTEHQVLLGLDDLVDHVLVADVVQVIHVLGALVAEPAKAMHAGGSLHGSEATSARMVDGDSGTSTGLR